MCGIAGAVTIDGPSRFSAAIAGRMGEEISHRGPDDSGSWTSVDGRVWFVHRRLAVIDLVTGQQPIVDDSSAHALVFNGEIYNYKELRKGLSRTGVRFRTSSDSEVLFEILRRHGEKGVSLLRGMFAFAYWDDDQKRLLLARDPLGKKPLFYSQRGDMLVFGSTLGSVRAALGYQVSFNPQAIESFLRLGYVPSPQTAFEGIWKLPPGTLLEFDLQGIRTERFWSVESERCPFDGSYQDALDALETALREAVRFRLQSDVPLGIFLSGGVDSSLIAAIAAKEIGKELRTFSISFSTDGYDEAEAAGIVSRHLGTVHQVFQGRLDLFELLPEVVRHFGEPFGDATVLPTWILAKEARRAVTVALCGDGGDEGFGGYEWYFTARRLSRFAAYLPSGAKDLMASMGSRLARGRPPFVARLGRALRAIGLPEGDRFGMLRSFLDPLESSRLLRGELLDWSQAESSFGDLAGCYSSIPGPSFHRMRCVDILTYLADCLLPKVDIATMAHGLEARAPLLDQQVLQLGLNMPDEWMGTPGNEKVLLRDLLRRYLPEDLVNRPKHGFNVPLSPWFAGDMHSRVEDLSRSELLLDSGWFQASGIRVLVDEHRAGTRDHGQRLFNLLVLEEWLRQVSVGAWLG